MAKASLGIYGILLLVWVTMLGLLLAAARFIVPFELPVPGRTGALLSSVVRTILGIAMALAWLYGWKRLYEGYFWKLMKSLEERCPETNLDGSS